MSPVHYIDASAWVKRFVEEPGSAQVSELFAGGGSRIFSSRLGELEIYSALTRRLWDGSVTELSFDAFRKQLDMDLSRRVRLIEFSTTIAEYSKSMIHRYNLRTNDAIHLATAIACRDRGIGAGGDTFVFVCSDRHLNEAAREERLTVMDPAAGNVPDS